MRPIAITLMAFVSLWCQAQSQCSPSPQARKIIDQVQQARNAKPIDADSYPERVALLDSAIAKHGNDYFLLRARMLTEPSNDLQLQWAETRSKERPGSPVYGVLYASSLLKKNAADALKMLGMLTASKSAPPQAYLQLADTHSVGRLKDSQKLHRDVDEFLKRCPVTLDSDALEMISRGGTKEQMGEAAASLREQLTDERDPLLLPLWHSLWNLEFKSTPLAGQDKLRARVAQDLLRLRKIMPRTPQLLALLLHGHELLGDLAGKEKLGNEITREYPLSIEAAQVVRERWDKQHVAPKNAKRPERDAFYKRCMADADAWQKRFPNDSYIAYKKMNALVELSKPLPDQTRPPKRLTSYLP